VQESKDVAECKSVDFPGGQFLQPDVTSIESWSWNCPFAQDSQALPDWEFRLKYVPLGQKEHAAADTAPSVDETFPVEHERQRAPKSPSPLARYLPEGHFTQDGDITEQSKFRSIPQPDEASWRTTVTVVWFVDTTNVSFRRDMLFQLNLDTMGGQDRMLCIELPCGF
jgi:hypothetical protein